MTFYSSHHSYNYNRGYLFLDTWQRCCAFWISLLGLFHTFLVFFFRLFFRVIKQVHPEAALFVIVVFILIVDGRVFGHAILKEKETGFSFLQACRSCE